MTLFPSGCVWSAATSGTRRGDSRGPGATSHAGVRAKPRSKQASRLTAGVQLLVHFPAALPGQEGWQTAPRSGWVSPLPRIFRQLSPAVSLEQPHPGTRQLDGGRGGGLRWGMVSAALRGLPTAGLAQTFLL